MRFRTLAVTYLYLCLYWITALRCLLGDRVHRRWASCLRSNALLQSSLNQGVSLLCTRITLIGMKRSTSRDKCIFNISTGLSGFQILRQGSSPISSQSTVQLTRVFQKYNPANTRHLLHQAAVQFTQVFQKYNPANTQGHLLHQREQSN